MLMMPGVGFSVGVFGIGWANACLKSIRSNAVGVRETWYHFSSGPNEPAYNMAVDDALLEACSRWGAPILRTYGWTEPAATFGYFQKYAELAAITPLRPLIRRPTGGGLVPHDRDWTYSLVVPPQHPRYRLRAEESYREMHDWVRRSLAVCGVEAVLSPGCDPEGPGQCFLGAERHDLLWKGRKIAGAAQRRNRLGLLIQGSLQPPADLEARRMDWESAMRQVVDVDWRNWFGDTEWQTRVEQLMETRYLREDYNAKR